MGQKKDHHHGEVRMRHEHTNEIILIPTPSNDPKDPLNWPNWFKHYVAGLSSWAILLGTFCNAGPSIAIPQMAAEYFGPFESFASPSFYHALAQVSYFFTVSSMTMGVSNLFWIPFAVKYGRRPVYVASFVLYAATAVWCAVAKDFGSMLAARTIMGCAAGAGEVLGPLTIADLYFAHERGKMMVIYTTTLSLGVGLGTIVSGAVILDHSWRVIFWVATALTGSTALVMFLTLPETIYYRDPSTLGSDPPHDAELNNTRTYQPGDSEGEGDVKPAAEAEQIEEQKQRSGAGVDSQGRPILLLSQRPPTHLPTFAEIVLNVPKSHTKENMWLLSLRPLILICLPAVLWASLVMSVSIGFLVALSTNLATAFGTVYGFTGSQAAWCYGASVLGSLLAIFFGGKLTDLCVDFFARRNGGVRDPEMRLPSMVISLVTGPLALILYGVGIGKELHWICPVIGLGLLNFTIVQSGNISIVYMIDCYRPIAGEVTVTQYAFKSLFGFLLSFYTNPWIESDGYEVAFGEMAAISGAVFLLLVPFFLWGKKLRVISWHWGFVRRTIHWHEDREVGE